MQVDDRVDRVASGVFGGIEVRTAKLAKEQ